MDESRKTEQEALAEAARLRASAKARLEELKAFWRTFAVTGVILLALLAVGIRGGFGWFLSNTRVGGAPVSISASGQPDFALATVGKNDQGVYDSKVEFGLSKASVEETIQGTTYYLATGNSSFRVDSDKNFNNFLNNADLRPGNRGSFDLYVLCRTDKRVLTLQPAFSVWNNEDLPPMTEAEKEAGRSSAAEFLKGHILLFAGMDSKGMYSGSIDYTQSITINLDRKKAEQSNREFDWGEQVAGDGKTSVYRLRIYWVWPEQFGNFLYTGNAYNKNLFSEKNADYERFITAMESDEEYQKFFCIEGSDRPSIRDITDPNTHFQTATQNYELYSGWYNAADEKIGEFISYVGLGFELLQGDTSGMT